MSLVVDASSVVDYLLRGSPATAELFRVEQLDLHAPELIDLETASALRSLMRGGTLGHDRARMMVDDYLDLPICLHAHRPLLPRVLELHHNFSPYDAAYLALAERIGATFLTADEPLARAARRHTSVQVVTPAR